MPIFEGDGRPLAFHLDASIRKGARQKLEADIKEHGGTVVERLSDADFSLVDEQHLRGGRTLLSLGQAYGLTFPNLRFRGLNFVQSCIRQGAIFTPVVIRKAMGGVPPREQRGRREYTSMDDLHLAEYLATVVPDPASGGRTGNAIYSKLCSNPEIPWARNHPWESWRTRYKNKRNWFDSKVADIVRARPANPEALHTQDRRLNRRPYNGAYLHHHLSAGSDDDEGTRGESPAVHLREEEEERTDEEADPPNNPQASLSPSFRPSPVDTQKADANLGKRARRPRDSTQSEQISQQEPATLGKRARRHTGGDESPLKRARIQDDRDDEVRAPQDAISLNARASDDIEYFFDDALRDFHPEPGPSNTQRTLVNHSFPPVETLDPESPPRSSQTTTAPRLPRTSQQTLVGSSPRLQPSRKGKERRIHFDSDSDDDSDFDVGLFGDPIPPVREAEAATPNATPSPPKERPHDRESQPPPSEEFNYSDNESTDDLFDQTGYDILHEARNPVVETQDEEQVIEDSDAGSVDDLFDQPGYEMSHKSQTPVAEIQDEEPDIEDLNDGSVDDQLDQTGYDMLDESQYPTVETQEDEQDIEDLLLADPANSSTRSNITRSENVSAASQRESSSEQHSDDEQSLDTDDRQIDAMHKVSRSLSTPLRHSSLGQNDRNFPEESQSGSDLDSDDAQTRDTIKGSVLPVSPAISATSSVGMSPIADTKILPATPGVLSQPRPGSSTRNRNGPRSMERDFGSPPSNDSDEDVVPSPGIRARLRSAKTQPVVDPKTPKRAAALSDSSVDNTIPSPFTRAWQVKQELDRAAKQRPYEPPPGTRAARVRSERRL